MTPPSKRILVLGGLGMLGHRLMLSLDELGYEILGTARPRRIPERDSPTFGPALRRPLHPLDATKRIDLETLLRRLLPDAVINCIGWVRQRPLEGRLAEAITVNAVFPHWLAQACQALRIGLIHISTDCVQDDDWYGSSKRLGESIEHGAVLRTSFVGHELERRLGLLEWFLRQRGSVDGYASVFWNGLTTNELAGVIGSIVIPNLEQMERRVWEICGPETTKGALLELVGDIYGCPAAVRPVDEPVSDRRLDGRAFSKQFGYEPPAWPKMLQTMRDAQLGADRAAIDNPARIESPV